MTIPSIMGSDLDYTEAINLAELTERGEQLFAARSNVDICTRYNTLFPQDEWRAVHAIHNGLLNVGVLILQQVHTPQFVILCHHDEPIDDRSLLSNIASTVTMGRRFSMPSFSMANISPGDWWPKGEQSQQSHAASYEALPGEAMLLADAKVYQPWLTAWEAVQTELDLFFKTLAGLTFVQPLVDELGQIVAAPHQMFRTAMGTALRIRFGEEAGEEMEQLLLQPAVPQEEQRASTPPNRLAGQPIAISPEVRQMEAETPTVWSIPESGLQLSITGHGAGGPIAVLSALHVRRDWEARLDFPLVQLKLYTFGSPKIGNHAFVTFHNRLLQGCSFRVQNLLDAKTFGPPDETPLPYSLPNPLPIRLPAMEKLGTGWMSYEHVGEPFVHPGIGNAPSPFNFLQGLKPPMSPFSHDPAGYKALLADAQHQSRLFSVPLQQMQEQLDEQKDQLSTQLQSMAVRAQSQVTALLSNWTK